MQQGPFTQKAPHLSPARHAASQRGQSFVYIIPIPASSRGRKQALFLAHPLERLPALLPNRSAAANLNGEVSSMSGSMPPPPARQPGNNDLRRAALQAAGTLSPPRPMPPFRHPRSLRSRGLPAGTQHSHRADAHREAAEPCVPRDASLPLPLPWTAYFDRRQRVWCPERQATFNVYTAGGDAAFCTQPSVLLPPMQPACQTASHVAAVHCFTAEGGCMVQLLLAEKCRLQRPTCCLRDVPMQAALAPCFCACTAAATRGSLGRCSPSSSRTGACVRHCPVR